jgi:uncharacterized protein YjbI with pentapeptide repeats
VDVVCAYLRMPYTLLAQPELDADDVEETAIPASGRDQDSRSASGLDPAREELQVRRTAQRLLADHLRCPPRTSGQDAQLLPASLQQTFWPGISLDLTGATLVDFNFAQVSVVLVQFAGATFHGDAGFAGAAFQGAAWFSGATFQGDAWFGRAAFQRDAWFGGAAFQRAAWFGGAAFQGDARFGGATFQRAARFEEATFQRAARFEEATFQRAARFEEATFQGAARFDEAHVLHFDNRDSPQVWPDGWIVRPDSSDPSRGTLIPAEHATESQPAVVSPSDPADNGSGTG